MMGCTINQTETKKSSSRHVSNKVSKAYDNKTILSYVRAYLLIGNIEKAEEHFGTLKTPELIPGAILVLAELQAAKGNSVDAQQTFLLALTDTRYDAHLNKEAVSANLLDYFCTEKKWPALQGYGAALVVSDIKENIQNASPSAIHLKNSALTQIGLCFFEQQLWDEANKWLQKLDVTQQLEPKAYLALARIAVEQKLYSDAQDSITQYEKTKDTVDAKTLWAAIEVYLALNQFDMATQTGENLLSLFPNNQYTRNYIVLEKRDLLSSPAIQSTPEQTKIIDLPKDVFHSIKKGETLYQLSKRYGVSIPELQSWNPSIVIENISVGTQIRITRIQ
jgi:Tfp pilus assembly protein PilF